MLHQKPSPRIFFFLTIFHPLCASFGGKPSHSFDFGMHRLLGGKVFSLQCKFFQRRFRLNKNVCSDRIWVMFLPAGNFIICIACRR